MPGSRHPYHFRFHDDALRGTFRLNLEQRGALITLLDLMYSAGGYLEECERRLAAEMGVSTRKYRSLRDQLIKCGKLFYICEGYLANHRVEEEIQRRTKRSIAAAENGRKGGHQKAENDAFRRRHSTGFSTDSEGRNIPRNTSENSDFLSKNNKGGWPTSGSPEPNGENPEKPRDGETHMDCKNVTQLITGAAQRMRMNGK